MKEEERAWRTRRSGAYRQKNSNMHNKQTAQQREVPLTLHRKHLVANERIEMIIYPPYSDSGSGINA